MGNITRVHKLQLIFFVLLCIVSIQLTTFIQTQAIEDTYRDWEELNRLAEQIFFLVQKNEFDASKVELQRLSTYFLSLETGQYMERLDQLQMMIDTIVQAQASLNSAELHPEQVRRKIIRMRLALDAVSHKKQPLWLNYYPAIMMIMDRLVYSLDSSERDSFYNHVNLLAMEYELLRPALVMSHQQSTVVKLDSKIKYLTNQQHDLWSRQREATQFLQGMEADWKRVFFQLDEQSSVSFITLILVMGTLIGSVLSYVAWKKYKGEKEIRQVVWKK